MRACEEEQAVIDDRAELYRGFLEEALSAVSNTMSGMIAIGVHDRHADCDGYPVFQFQKTRGSDVVLLPDVDLIRCGFFEDTGLRDPMDFEDKRDHAMFVGSTTGGALTYDSVSQLTHPRVRTAVGLKGQPGITFELPRAGGFDAPETERLFRGLGIEGRERSWPEQFENKYLISIDGNGATCSRVVMALGSNSVMIKYASARVLYYFHGLQPWLHYLPVRKDADVIEIIKNITVSGVRDSRIAVESRDFARAHLNRFAVISYAAALVQAYLSL